MRITLLLVSIVFSSVCLYGECAENVSIYRVISNPADFSNKAVAVQGVLGLIGKGTVALFVDKGSYQSEIFINSLIIASDFVDSGETIAGYNRDELMKLDGKYATVWCTLSFSDPRNKLFSGSIKDRLFRKSCG